MTDALCAWCRRAVHDQAYICVPCATPTSNALAAVRTVAGDALATIARLDHIVRIGTTEHAEPEPDEEEQPARKPAGALFPTPMLYNPTAARRFDAAVTELLSQARRVEEERGITATIHLCRHNTCAAIAERLAVGPVCAARGQHPLAQLASFLASQVDWLRHQRDADENLNALTSACHAIIGLVDRPVDAWFAGECDQCRNALWPNAGAKKIRCRDCGATYDAEERRAAMLDRIADVWLEPTQCAHALAMLGVDVKADTIRKWGSPEASRALLAPHPESRPGRPRYRVGSVRELAEQLIEERRAREAKTAARREKELIDS